jgi:hypothetical protein
MITRKFTPLSALLVVSLLSAAVIAPAEAAPPPYPFRKLSSRVGIHDFIWRGRCRDLQRRELLLPGRKYRHQSE